MSIAIIYLIINIKFKLFFKIKAWLIPCFGGGGRIRTIEANRNRFTVCPLWPLGNSPISYINNFTAVRYVTAELTRISI